MPRLSQLASRLRRASAPLAVAAIATCGAISAAPSVAHAASPDPLSGAYAGPADVSGLTQFGQWRGAIAPVALDYLGNSGWNDISNPQWLLDAWKPYVANGGTLVLSVPMLVDSPQGSFADGAAGDYDQYYETLGQDLVAEGEGNVILRMGWEFNGTWFPWSLSSTNSSMSAGEYVADYQHLVNLFRAIPGSNFKFDWTVNPGPSDVPAASAYPGNAYVDYIGVDVYDASWDANGAPISDPTARWNEIANQTYGLNWWNTFAQQHGKPIAVPEWGLNTDTAANGAGDDPSFIQDMYNWFQANHPAYEMYFNAQNSVLNQSDDPNASAEYSQLWGSTPSSSPGSTSSTGASSSSGSTGASGSSGSFSFGSGGSGSTAGASTSASSTSGASTPPSSSTTSAPTSGPTSTTASSPASGTTSTTAAHGGPTVSISRTGHRGEGRLARRVSIDATSAHHRAVADTRRHVSGGRHRVERKHRRGERTHHAKRAHRDATRSAR